MRMPVSRRQLDQLCLLARPDRARFREARGDDDAAADAELRGLGDAREHALRRHRENGDVRRRRHRLDPRIGLVTRDFGTDGIDRIDVPGEAVAGEEMDDAPAELGDALGGPEHRDRARMQDALDGDARRGAALGVVSRMQNHDFVRFQESNKTDNSFSTKSRRHEGAAM